MGVKNPKEIMDVVHGCSMHPTSDSWYPSFERGCKDRPEVFVQCECLECLALTNEEYQKHALWDWQDGGTVACFLMLYDEPRYYLSKPRPGDPYYMARIAFWGADDSGMEKWFQYEEDARRFICHLPSYISKEFLLDHGFVGC